MKQILSLLLAASISAFAGETKSLKIGEATPSFSLKNYDGKEYALEKIIKEHKLTVLMFISTECPVSNAYNKRMTELYQSYAKKGVAFIGINANKQETMNDIAEHSSENGFKFPVLKDVGNVIADAYGAQVTPETYLIQPNGKLAYHGRIDDSRNVSKVESCDLALALDALLDGKEPPRTEARAFGCTIKRVAE